MFEQGEHEAAAELFDKPEWQASSRYQAGDYSAALETWQQLEGADALYNRGNALARLGRLDEALQAYETLLRDDPGHQDALYNKQQIEKFLEQQQQQQQNQQQNQQGEQQQESGQGERQGDPSQADSQQGKQPQGDPQQAQQQPGQDGAQDSGPQNPAEGEPRQTQGDAAEQSEAQQAERQPDTNGPAQGDAEQLTRLDQQMSEQAAEQWLRKIPDDPGGLLRRKFLYQYRKRGGVDAEGQSW
jgi:Ca-activated chloride channel family protein